MCPAFDNEVRVTAKRGEEDNDAARWADKRINGVCTLGIKREIYDSSFTWIVYRSGATLTERRSIPFPVSLAPSSVHSSRLRKRIEKLNRARFFANTFFGLLYFFFLNLESGDENVKRTFGGGISHVRVRIGYWIVSCLKTWTIRRG